MRLRSCRQLPQCALRLVWCALDDLEVWLAKHLCHVIRWHPVDQAVDCVTKLGSCFLHGGDPNIFGGPQGAGAGLAGSRGAVWKMGLELEVPHSCIEQGNELFIFLRGPVMLSVPAGHGYFPSQSKALLGSWLCLDISASHALRMSSTPQRYDSAHLSKRTSEIVLP